MTEAYDSMKKKSKSKSKSLKKKNLFKNILA